MRELRELQAVAERLDVSWQRTNGLWLAVGDAWRDEARASFGRHHVDPLEGQVLRYRRALQDLIEALEDAERQLR